jgi:hypothetical protein
VFCCLSFWRKDGASCSILNRCYKVASSQLFLVCVHSFASFRSIVDTYCGRQAEARGIVVFGISLWPPFFFNVACFFEFVFRKAGHQHLSLSGIVLLCGDVDVQFGTSVSTCHKIHTSGTCLFLRGQSLRTRFVCACFLCAAEVRCNDGAPRVVRAGRLLRAAVHARRILCASFCTFTRLSSQAVNLVCLLPRRGGWLHLGSQFFCASLMDHVPPVVRALPPTSSQREWVTTPSASRRQHCRPSHRLRHRLLSLRLGLADRTLSICPSSIGRSFQRLHYR